MKRAMALMVAVQVVSLFLFLRADAAGMGRGELQGSEPTPVPYRQVIYQGTVLMDEAWIAQHKDEDHRIIRVEVPLPGPGYLPNWDAPFTRLDDPNGWCAYGPGFEVYIRDPQGEIKNFWDWTSGGTAIFEFGECLSSDIDPYPYKIDLTVYWDPDSDGDKVPDYLDQCPDVPQPGADNRSSGCPLETPTPYPVCELQLHVSPEEIGAGEIATLDLVVTDSQGPVVGRTASVMISNGPGAVDGPYETDANGEATFTYLPPEQILSDTWVELQAMVDGCPGEMATAQLALLAEGASATNPMVTPTATGPVRIKVSVLDKNAAQEPYLGIASDGVSTLALVAELSGPASADQVSWDLELLGEGTRAGWLYADERSDASHSVVIFKPPEAFEQPFAVRVTARVWAPSGESVQDSVDIRVVRPPVLLVHGIWSTRISMVPLGRFLLLTDQFALVRTVDYGLSPRKSYDDMRKSVQYVAEGVEGALARFDQMGLKTARVDIVAHSMGGLLSRLYIVGDGHSLPPHSDKVRKLITLATPHGGSPVADWYTDLMDNRFVRCNGDKSRFSPELVTENELEWLLNYVRRQEGLAPDALTFGPAVRQMQTVAQAESIVHVLLNRKAHGVQTEYHAIAGNRPLIGSLKEAFAPWAIWLDYPYKRDEVVDPNSQVPSGTVELPPGPCGETWRRAVLAMVSGFVEMIGKEGTDGVVSESSGLGLGTGMMPKDRVTFPLDHFSIAQSSRVMYEVVRYLTNYQVILRNGTMVTSFSPGRLHVFDASGAHIGVNAAGEVEVGIEGGVYESFADAAGEHEFIWVPQTSDLVIQFAADREGVAAMDVGVVDGGSLDWSRYDDLPVQPGTVISVVRDRKGQSAQVAQPDGQVQVLEPTYSERVMGRVPGGFEPLWGLLGASCCGLLVLGAGTMITGVAVRKRGVGRGLLYFLIPLTLGLAVLTAILAVLAAGAS